MNKKIETIHKELIKAQTERNNKIEKLKKELVDIENNIKKCQEEMKKAVESESLDNYHKAATKKSYYESRQVIVSGNIEAVKAEVPAGSYADTRAAIISAFEETQAEFLKVLVKDAIKHEDMAQVQRAQFADAGAVLNLLNDVYNETEEGKKQFSILDYNNSWSWAHSGKRSPVFRTTTEAHPEYME